ncbi:MAG: hypothetical protein JNM28_06480 [Armatimonadetes bacterium]|nr:hypothetical protein [Armatimonadota bacterium]
MKNRAITAALLILGPTMLLAQSFEEKTANVDLLREKPVQTELGITDALRDKMNKVADEFNKNSNELLEAFKKDNPNAQGPDEALVKKINTFKLDLNRKILKLLSPAQVKRLSEITLQILGYQALLSDDVAKKIGLDAAQSKKLRDGFTSLNRQVQEVQQKALKPIYDKYGKQQPKNEEEAKALQEKANKEAQEVAKSAEPELTKLRNEWLTLVKKTVKAIQLNRFEALQGQPFKAS